MAHRTKQDKPCAHTKDDKHESMQLVKKQAACNKTRQRKSTRPNPNRVPYKTQHTRTEERTARANWRPHAPTARLTWSVSVRSPIRKPEPSLNKTGVPESEHHAPKGNRARRRERARSSSTLEPARSPENKTRGECQSSVTKPRIN